MHHDLNKRRRSIERERSRFDPDGAAETGEDPVHDSWVRCAPTLAVRQDAAPLDEADTAAERWEASPIRRAWPGLTDEMQHIAEDGDLVAAVTDEHGRILWSWGGRWMRDRAETVNFTPGGRWDERSVGTNAVALALITGRPSTVFSVEHWCTAVHDWVCYSAPVLDAAGRPLGIVDLSTTWDHANPLGLSMVNALVRVVEQQTRLSPAPPDPAVAAPGGLATRSAFPGVPGRPLLDIRVLGSGRVALGATPVLLTPRQMEILTILACIREASLDQLHALLHGDRRVSPITTKVEISQMRRVLGDVIASRPYRLTVPTRIDLVTLLDHLNRGDLDGAIAEYRGQLLPASEAPFLVEQRHHCDVALRTALLRRGTTEQLVVFAETHPHDTEVLERAVAVAAGDEPLLPTAVARLAVARVS
jgi:hypothetical protein